MVITGVIRPPPEIRAVADRTASYVAKNGRTFEARILNSAKGKTPKFAFLQPTSPFHAYYEERIKFYEEGGEDVEEKKADETTQQQQQEKQKKPAPGAATKPQEGTTPTTRKTGKTQVASAIDPVAKALLDQRAKITQARAKQKEVAEAKQAEDTIQQPEPSSAAATTSSDWQIPAPPPLDLVAIVAPTGLSTSQIELIQLVAQFAALDGKGGIFLHQLSMREWTNPDFAFCQPRHAHFPFFSALVDAYRRIITDWVAVASEKSNNEPTDQDQDQTKDIKDKDNAKQIQAVLEEAAYRAEFERDRLQQRSQHEDGEIVAIDWHSFVVVETIDFPVDEKVELSMLPPPPPPPPPRAAAALPTATTATTQSATAQEASMDESDADDDDEDEAIRVVPSYTPKVVATANPQATRAIDPITGKSVPVSDVPEHLRIQLLDPRWAEERKKFQDKQKESNLVAGDAIVSNLTRFSQARGDLFGKSEQERLDKEKDSKRRLEEANRIIREQGNQPAPGFPSLPTVGTVGAGSHHTMEPEAKRLKVDYNDVINIPPPPPPPPRQPIVIPPPPPPPPTTTTTGPSTAMEPSGIPMADALLLASNNANSETSASQLIPEAEFAASLSKPEVTLQIRIPNDPTQMAWNFYGQILSLQVNVMSTIKKVKEDLSRIHLNGMPVNKIQLKDPNAGFYNNNNATLAALNIGPTATLEMAPKVRGGRR